MGMAVDGLISGLDTTSLINSLMQAEAIPQTLLKSKVTDSTTYITAMQALNSKIAALADLATKTSKPAGVDLHTATSSSTGVTATAGPGATDGNLDFTVDRLAQAQVTVSGPLTQWPDQPPVLTFVSADGTTKQITAASSSLADVAAAINSAGVGVSATRVSAGLDPSTGQQLYRLQLSSTKTGAAGAFTAYRGTPAQVTAGTATNLLSDPGAAQVRAAQDAQVTLWAGTGAAQTVTSSTNTFSDVLPGVTMNVTAASATPVTLTVAQERQRDLRCGELARQQPQRHLHVHQSEERRHDGNRFGRRHDGHRRSFHRRLDGARRDVEARVGRLDTDQRDLTVDLRHQHDERPARSPSTRTSSRPRSRQTRMRSKRRSRPSPGEWPTPRTC